MKKLFYTWILLMSFVHLFGQEKADTIEVRTTKGTVFLQNGQILSPRKLLEITQSNQEAYKEMKKAKGNYDAGMAFGYIGGFLVGLPLGTAIGGGDPNWALAGIGAGLLVISIPFSKSYKKHAINAAGIYNDGLRNTGGEALEMSLNFSSDGIGLRWTF